MSSIQTATPAKTYKTKRGVKLKKYSSAYIMLLPALLLVTALSYVPMLGVVIAFKEYNAEMLVMGAKNGIIQTIIDAPWVGWGNFIEIFNRPEMLETIGRTLFYGIVFVFGGFPFPIVLALLFNEIKNMKFKKVTQTITYMPHFLSMVSVIGMVSSMLAAEGPFNQLLVNIFGSEYQYTNPLLNADYFLPIIFTANLWKAIGWSSIVYLSAITGIDPTLYEAAEVDGCGKFKQVIKITIPCIAETMIILLIMELGKIVNTNFELVKGFQNAFIEEETDIISTYIYRKGLRGGEYDVSTAFGIAQGVVNLALVLSANAISKKISGAGIW